MPIYYNDIHELNYCLMCSVELCHIGADSARYVGNYMPNVSEWYDWREERNRNLVIGPDSNWYETFCKDFERDVENKYTRWVRTRAEPQEHANCTYDYLLNASNIFNELIETYVGELIDDLSEKNANEDYILETAKKNLPEHAVTNKRIRNLLRRHRKFKLRNKNVDVGRLREAEWATTREYLDKQAFMRRQYDELILGTKSPKEYSKQESKLVKAYRKVARKSVQVLSSMTDKETTSAFINGDHVDIIGDLFTYRITRNAMLTVPSYSSHGALKIQVLDTDTSTHLFNLCWYLNDTPPAEQLLGFMLHVRAGNEEDILRTGNSFSLNLNVPIWLADTVNKKLSRVYSNKQMLVPYNIDREKLAVRKNTGDLSFILSPHRSKLDNYEFVKSQLKREVIEFIKETFPQFNNFVYQRNRSIKINDQVVSTLTKDFKLLTKGEE